MTEAKALILIVATAVVATTLAMLGLAAAHAQGTVIALGGIVPALIASHLCSRVVMHYGASDRRHR